MVRRRENIYVADRHERAILKMVEPPLRGWFMNKAAANRAREGHYTRAVLRECELQNAETRSNVDMTPRGICNSIIGKHDTWQEDPTEEQGIDPKSGFRIQNLCPTVRVVHPDTNSKSRWVRIEGTDKVKVDRLAYSTPKSGGLHDASTHLLPDPDRRSKQQSVLSDSFLFRRLPSFASASAAICRPELECRKDINIAHVVTQAKRLTKICYHSRSIPEFSIHI
ncbi:hypothetical protein B0H34DRAFT_679558 [Crassisporium funariophilum]|nr:hypothetical protein B0H34DRAFT_679558 [Crassisporium funariophilum]